MIVYILIFIAVLFSPMLKGGTTRLSLFILQITALIILSINLYYILKNKKTTFSLTILEAMLIILIGLTSLSSILNTYQHEAQRSLILFITFIIFYLHIIERFKLRDFEIIWRWILGLGVLESIIGLYQTIFLKEYRSSGTFFNPNHLAALLSCLIILLLSRIIFDKSYRKRLWINIPIICILGTALFFTRSRGGFLSLICGLSILILTMKRARKKALLIFTISIILLILIPNPLITRIKEARKTDVYAYSRLSMWNSALKMLKDYPIFGIGIGNFKYFTYRYAFPVKGAWARYAKVANYAHNEPLHYGAEMGLSGILFIILALFIISKLLLLGRKGDKDIIKIKYPLFIAIITIFSHSLVDIILHLPPLILILIILIAWIRQINIEHNILKPYTLNISEKGVKILVPILLLLTLLSGWIVIRQYVGYLYFSKTGSNDLLQEFKKIESAISWDFACAPYHNSLGGAYFRMYGIKKDPYYLNQGIKEAELAQKLNPEDHHFPLSLGLGYLNLYKISLTENRFLDLAEKEFNKSIKLAPYYYPNYTGLGRVLFYKRRYKDSLSIFKKIIELEPLAIPGHYWLSLTYKALGDTNSAELEDARITEIKGMGLEKKVQNEYESGLLTLKPDY